ncbi:MAG: hypothetical protein ACQEQ4_09185 [Fibrobacterota bacterium]
MNIAGGNSITSIERFHSVVDARKNGKTSVSSSEGKKTEPTHSRGLSRGVTAGNLYERLYGNSAQSGDSPKAQRMPLGTKFDTYA